MHGQRAEVVVVGGGQAGLAMSYHLTNQGREHVVLEQERIAASWRNRRWDSLCLVGPNWTLRLPGYAYADDEPDSFMGKDDVVERLMAYAESFGAPVREGVRVASVEREGDGGLFAVRTGDGTYHAAQVVIATGALQRPFVPGLATDLPAEIAQYVPYSYKRPADLPPGAVLIVGSGQSGCQIAEELRRAGREVYLSVSRSWGAPRRYRDQDHTYWSRAVGWMDRKVTDLPPGARVGLPNPQLTGAGGGHDLTLYTLVNEGVVLLGRLTAIRDGKFMFAPDLATNLAWGHEQARRFLQSIDDYVLAQSLDAPAEDMPTCLMPPDARCAAPPEELDVVDSGIGSVVWATGYRPDLDWVRLAVLDNDGYPIHQRGVTAEPGLYFLGLDWLYTSGSGLFSGLSDDAAYLASYMAGERSKRQKCC
jgi:putative flavoprotein involved in K+ transport